MAQTILLQIKAIDGTTKVLDAIGGSFKKLTREAAVEDKKSSSFKTATYRSAMTDIQRMEKDRARWNRVVADEITRTDRLLASNRIKEQKRAANAMISTIGEIRKASEQSARQSASAFSSVFGGTFFGNLGSRALSELTAAFTRGASALVDYSGKLEQTQVALTTLMNSSQGAARHLQDLQKLSLATPFQLDSFARISQRLQGVGVSVLQVIPLMKDLGNITAATGDVTAERFEGIAQAVSQLISKTKVSAEEMEQLAERGVPAWQLLSEATGKTQAELRKLSEQGKITSDEMIAALQKIANQKFGDAMERQANTFNGALSSISNALLITADTAFKPLFAEITKFSVDYSKSLRENAENTSNFGRDTSFILSGIIQLWKDAQGAADSYFSGLILGGGLIPATAKTAGQVGLARALFGSGALGEYLFRSGQTVESQRPQPEPDFIYNSNRSIRLNPVTNTVEYLGGSTSANIPPSTTKTSVAKKIKEFQLSDDAKAIMQAARTLGVSPLDLAGIIGFETGGTFSPNKIGGAGNKYRGLIQFGPEERQLFGVRPGQSFADQLLNSVVPFFQQRFAQTGRSTQGASLLDLYTTVIAGNPNANRDARDAFGTSARSGAARIAREQIPAALRRFFGDSLANIEDFGQTSRIESETKKLIDAFEELTRSKGKILELTKELGLVESNYAANTQTEAEASIKRLETIRELTEDWQKQTENASRELYEIRNSAKGSAEKAEDLFEQISKKAGLSAADVEFLRQRFGKLKEKIDELNKATQTRPRIVPWQMLPGNEWGLEFQGDPNATRPSNRPTSEFRSFRDELELQFDELQRGNREMTEYERVLREIEKTYRHITPEQREYVLNLARQIDEQSRFNEQFGRTQDFIRDTLDILTDSGKSFGEKMKDIFRGIYDSFRRMLIDMAAQWLTSKLFKTVSGGGFSFGNLLKGLFGDGGGGFGGFTTPPFNPHGRRATASGASSVQAAAQQIFNSGGARFSFADFARTGGGTIAGHGGSAGPAGGGMNKAGILSLIGIGANFIGSAIGGRAGGVLSGAGTGLALGAQIGSVIPGLGTLVGAGIGALVGGIAGLFGGDPKRREDKKQNLPALRQGFADSIAEFKRIIADLDGARVTSSEAVKRVDEIRASILSGFNIDFKSKKYRKISQSEIRKQLSEIDRPGGLMEQLRAAISRRREGEEFRNRFIATFADGVFMDEMFASQFGDFKRRNGYLSGGVRGKDSLPALLMPKEMVINERQAERARRLAGFDVFAYSGIPNYPKPKKMAEGGFVGTTGSLPAGGAIVIEELVLNVRLNNSVGISEKQAAEITVVGLKTSDGQNATVKAVRAHVDQSNSHSDGLLRDLKKADRR